MRLAGRALTPSIAAAVVALVAFAFLWSPGGHPEPLLVADLRGRALVVLDPTHPNDARRIALPGGPHELLRLPGGRVVVSLEQSGLLAVVDLGSGAVEVRDVGGLPHGLALAEGTLLVTDRSDSAVRRFALDPWRELDRVAVDEWPHAVAVLPDGRTAVASAVPGTLTIGDISHLTGATTETVAVSPDGTQVATASAHDGVVSIFSPEGGLLGRYDVGGRPVRVAYAPDGDLLAVALSAGHAVAAIEDGQVTALPVQGVPDGLAFSSDGRWLYVSDVYSGTVTAVDVAERQAAAILRVGEGTGALLALAR